MNKKLVGFKVLNDMLNAWQLEIPLQFDIMDKVMVIVSWLGSIQGPNTNHQWSKL